MPSDVIKLAFLTFKLAKITRVNSNASILFKSVVPFSVL